MKISESHDFRKQKTAQETLKLKNLQLIKDLQTFRKKLIKTAKRLNEQFIWIIDRLKAKNLIFKI